MAGFNPYLPSVPFFGTMANGVHQDENVVSDQGLLCLHTGIAIRTRIQMKKVYPTSLKWTKRTIPINKDGMVN